MITVEQMEEALAQVVVLGPDRGSIEWWVLMLRVANRLYKSGQVPDELRREVRNRLAEARRVHAKLEPPVVVRFDGHGNLIVGEG